jgi:phosphatidylcholine synthase
MATPRRPWDAWLVHLFTASGAVLAFLAVVALERHDLRGAFAFLFVAVLVDAADGWLARRAQVAARTPFIDGPRLDDLVDYLTFVFVPMLIVWRAELLPAGWGLGVVAAVLLASALGFVHADAKTADYFFTGFPSYWNIVALYLAAFRWPPAVNALILMGLTALVFVRVGYVYPSRTPVLRGVTVGLGLLWGVLVAAIVATLPAPPRGLVTASLFYPLYYTGLSWVLHARRRAAAASAGPPPASGTGA